MYRISVIISTLIYIDFFGLLPRKPYIQIIADILIFSSLCYLLFYDKKIKLPKYFIKNIIYLFVFIGLYLFYTIINGGVGLINLYKMIRIFFPLLLSIIICYDILKNKDKKVYIKLLLTCGVIVTIILFLISVLKVNWFDNWPGISYGIQREQYNIGLLRVYMHTTFIFPIVCFIFILTQYLNDSSKRKSNYLLLIIFAIGFVLQGYRSYIIATIIAILYNLFLSKDVKKYLSNKKLKKIYFGIFIIGLFIMLSPFGRRIFKRISSGVVDLIEVKGTFASRIAYDAFRFKIFLDHPLLGIGLVQQDSKRAQTLGAKKYMKGNISAQKKLNIGFYSLRSTDSGYLDILVLFGLVGGGIFYLIFYRFYKSFSNIKSKKKHNIVLIQSVKALILVYFFTQITSSSFANVYGLIPLSILLGITSGSLETNSNVNFYLLSEGIRNY